MTEILAPAGGREQLEAAVRAGADAVYLGLKSFSARAGAENFDEYGLKSAVSYCHARNVKVHVALNTLIKDSELSNMAEQIRLTALSGADAVIVQDLAVAQLVRRICPAMPMHASTQMSIYNSDGVKQAAELGFSRAVLARELELSEIRSIAAHSQIEIEVFIHGALCMCISGACFLSSMIGGRSGNRGCCAQPCRLDMRIGEKPYALSLKDMSSVDYIAQLQDMGVCSFKIEGRMKRPEYVACAVKAVRDALDGKRPDICTLRDVFSRSGFTSGYIAGKRTADMFGRRTPEDAAKSASALGKARELYRRERQSVPVSMALSVCSDKAVLKVSDGSLTAVSSTKNVEKAIQRPLEAESALKSLSKLGDTPFVLERLDVENHEGMTLRGAELNELRRSAAKELLSRRSEIIPKKALPAPIDIPRRAYNEPPLLRIRAEKYEQIPKMFAGDVILPLKEILSDTRLIGKYSDRLICELPPVIFEKDVKSVKTDLKKIIELGVMKASAENIGAIKIASELGMEVCGGFGLNAFNSIALDEYKKIGLKDITVSFELAASRIAALGSDIRRGAVIYGYLPLMRMRACPVKGKDGCSDCSGSNIMTDRKSVRFSIVCSEKKYTTLYNSVPLYTGDREMRNLDHLLIYFTKESAENALKVYNTIVSSGAFDGERTTGLYFRDVN